LDNEVLSVEYQGFLLESAMMSQRWFDDASPIFFNAETPSSTISTCYRYNCIPFRRGKNLNNETELILILILKS